MVHCMVNICFSILFMNLQLLLTVVCQKRERNVHHTFVLSLNSADFVFAACSSPWAFSVRKLKLEFMQMGLLGNNSDYYLVNFWSFFVILFNFLNYFLRGIWAGYQKNVVTNEVFLKSFSLFFKSSLTKKSCINTEGVSYSDFWSQSHKDLLKLKELHMSV